MATKNAKVEVTETLRKTRYNLAMVERTNWRKTGPRAIEAGIISVEQAAAIDDLLTDECERWSAAFRRNPFDNYRA